jgi:hypothetical protein
MHTQKQILYRIATEHKDNLPDIVARYFESFYLTTGVGYWKGQAEVGATIEVIGTDKDRATIGRLAHVIRLENDQEAVYVVEFPITSRLIERQQD